MNWYIGQEVACIDPTYKLVKDKIYVIQGLKKSSCRCPGEQIDVGHKSLRLPWSCDHCGVNEGVSEDGKAWYGCDQFAPLADITELEEILAKEPSKSVFGNQT